jgi:hypothetical protein
MNGGFSVIGSVATVALALALGFNAVIAAAGLVYAIGVLGMAWFCRGAGTQPDVQPMARRGLTWRRAYPAPAGA